MPTTLWAGTEKPCHMALDDLLGDAQIIREHRRGALGKDI
jgi:hypothetical protein